MEYVATIKVRERNEHVAVAISILGVNVYYISIITDFKHVTCNLFYLDSTTHTQNAPYDGMPKIRMMGKLSWDISSRP